MGVSQGEKNGAQARIMFNYAKRCGAGGMFPTKKSLFERQKRASSPLSPRFLGDALQYRCDRFVTKCYNTQDIVVLDRAKTQYIDWLGFPSPAPWRKIDENELVLRFSLQLSVTKLI